jgi:hypothetical protein
MQKKVSNGNRGGDTFRDRLGITRPASFSSSPIVQTNESGINAMSKKGADLTPKRLRHNDSQVEFITIESPPSDPESQVLTRRQREVQERQRSETAVFLDGLRSSSPGLPSPTKDGDIRTSVHLPTLRNSAPVPEVPLTPTLAGPFQETDDVFPGSSPTPGTKDKTESRIPSSLSVQELETCQSDPPSSPPELKGHSHSRRNIARGVSISPLRESESAEPLNHGLRADKDDGAGQSVDSSAVAAPSEGNKLQWSHAGGHVTDHSAHRASPASNKRKKPPVRAARGSQTPDRESADVIPDSFSDDLEQQLASQLEQDLELAADLDEIRETQSQPEPSRDVSMTRKRKRDATAESPSTPDRSKRRSLRRSAATAKGVAKDASRNSEDTGATSETHRPAPPREKVSTPSSSQSKQKRKADVDTGHVLRSGSRRRRSRINEGADENPVSSPANSEEPRQKRRRSTRLSGVAPSPVAEPEPEPEPVSRTPKTLRSHSKAVSPAQKAAGSTEESVGKTESRPLSESGLGGRGSVEAPEGIETEKGLPENEVAAVTETPDDNMRTEQEGSGEDGMDTDAMMKDTDGGASQQTSGDATTKNYICHGVQTNDSVNEVKVTGGAVLESLRQVLSNMKKVTLGKSNLKEVDNVLFDIRIEAHEAMRRHQE